MKRVITCSLPRYLSCSFGGLVQVSTDLSQCFEAATAVIKHMINVLAPSGLMRSSPDGKSRSSWTTAYDHALLTPCTGHFIFASFASAFLLKVCVFTSSDVECSRSYLKQLLRPDFVHILTREMEDEIFDSISRLITTFQEVAIDERHTPRLYARFLAGLLTKHRRGGSTITGRSQPQPPPSQLAVPSQSHSYGGSRGPSSSHASPAGMQAPHGSEPRHDSDAMQLKMNPPQNPLDGRPSTTATIVHQSDMTPYSHVNSALTFESNDVSMTEVLADGGTLATMHALNEAWWGNMMMPGYVFLILKPSPFSEPLCRFCWPDAPLMNSLDDGRLNGAGIPGIPGYGAFQVLEAQLAM